MKDLRISNLTVIVTVCVGNKQFLHIMRFLCRASGRSWKKSPISRDFQGEIREKNGRFHGNFAGIFEARFAEK